MELYFAAFVAVGLFLLVDCALSRALVEVMYGSLTDDAAMRGRGLQALLIDIKRHLKDD
jgi:hypothetical protein